MHPITFPEVNVPAFGKPKDWVDERDGVCLAIPAYVGEDQHRPGMQYVVTMWQPSYKDMEEISRGKPIVLQCWGGMPPVSLYTVADDGSLNEDPKFL